MPKTGQNPQIILCEKNKQFQNIIVCTNICTQRCVAYKQAFHIEFLESFIAEHPDYYLQGVIMATDKKTPAPKPSPINEKLYWVVLDEHDFAEVTESEIIGNPAQYLGKPIFEKPKDQYEVVIMLKKKGK